MELIKTYFRQAREIYNLTTEKKQLQHAIEKLRLELQEKNAQMISCKTQHATLINQKDLQMEIKLSEKQANINRFLNNFD